jgi:hypothetical protein
VAGAREGVVGYAKDVTGQKVSERRMQQAEKMAAIGQLASGVAHEINNPLGAIICYLDLLREDLQDMPAQLADLEVIAKNVRFCQGIVAGLLGFARRRPVREKTDRLGRGDRRSGGHRQPSDKAKTDRPGGRNRSRICPAQYRPGQDAPGAAESAAQRHPGLRDRAISMRLTALGS